MAGILADKPGGMKDLEKTSSDKPIQQKDQDLRSGRVGAKISVTMSEGCVVVQVEE
jgi:hypothetical protein